MEANTDPKENKMIKTGDIVTVKYSERRKYTAKFVEFRAGTPFAIVEVDGQKYVVDGEIIPS